MKRLLAAVALRALLPMAGLATILASPGLAAPVLRWGGDAEGGAPFVEADPNDPTVLRG